MELLQKVTSKGQITLPIAWRNATGARTIVLAIKEGGRIEITPARRANSSEYTVFDALRDNAGKGIKATDLARILQKLSV
jgi:bifunctional DNA-binding transcriptional regulator/antitoxin component of YhaV-PrlF toxin-antitoxin module